ncbi:MAG: alpha/beta fold hydrolase [Balneolaceae bacterium]
MFRFKVFSAFLCVLFVITGTATAQQFPEALTMKDIFHEPFIPGTRPSFAGFSPNGETIYYSWNDSAKSKTELYQAPLVGGDSEKAPKDVVRRYELSPNGEQVLFSEKGNLMLADANFSNKRVIISSKGADHSPKWNADGSKFSFIQNGDVWISGAKEAYLRQVTSKKEDEPGFNVSHWAGSKLILQQWDRSNAKEYYFPEYAGEFVKTGATKRGISTTIISVVSADSGEVKTILKHEGYARTDVSATGAFLAVDASDPAMKKRTITVYDLNTLKESILFEDETKGWLYNTSIEFAPATNKLMFQSERDGWNHIYTVNPDGTGFLQHTFGSYEVHWASWLSERLIAMATSQNDPGEVQLYTLDIHTNLPSKLTTDEGYRQGFYLSKDRKNIVYSKTFFNEPFDLYTVEIKNPQNEIQLTNSVPESFYEYDWQKEDYLRFTGRDGKTKLSMSVLKPVKRNPAGNPVVVFVHGAGSLQNVYKGWSSSYWREYLFHQFLTHQGYYVIEVDYRHSTGYGRKFREDVTNWMGKYETQDIEDGLAFLADNYDKADTSKVGIYGGSYGGFMALYAVGTSPERFDAAAALRAVTKWENYYYTNPHYTLPRLGDPKEFPEHYKRSNPITYADSLKRPVLILHGLIDNNVGFQDAAQYVERLIQSGNEDFDMMMYPTERHGFTSEHSWYDEYRRIYEFFNKHLK